MLQLVVAKAVDAVDSAFAHQHSLPYSAPAYAYPFAWHPLTQNSALMAVAFVKLYDGNALPPVVGSE